MSKRMSKRIKEIKKGEYIRTKYGYIAKCIAIHTSETTNGEDLYIFDIFVNDIQYSLYTSELNQIVKHSTNIIELLGEGDFINNFKISKIKKDIQKNRNYIYVNDYHVLAGEKIKSVLTKEMYDKCYYKVKK